MSDRPIEELEAGNHFRDGLVPRADAHNGAAPLWSGWALMEAFLAGIDYVRRPLPADATCYIERSKVREIIISVADEHVHVTEGILADIDQLPITTFADRR